MSEEGGGQDKRVDIRKCVSRWIAECFVSIMGNSSMPWISKAP
jgi:hypothetical protein